LPKKKGGKKMSRKMFLFVLAFVLILSVLGVGCNSDAPTVPDNSSDNDDVIKIVYIPKNTGNPYFDSILKGFEEASSKLGFEFTSVAPANADATSQISFVREQIQRGVDVIAIAPNSPDALNQVFKEAMDAGIIVMIVNSDIPGSEDFRHLAVLPTDFDIVGESQVELLGSLIDYEGEIAILSATTDAPDQNYWIEGMKTALNEAKYAKMELVEIAYGDDDPQKSLTETEALLIKYPNLRGIISPTTVGVAAAAQAVETAGRAPELQVTGLGTPNQMRRFVKDSAVTAFALWNPNEQGELAGYLGYWLATGELEAAEGVTFTVPGQIERSFGKDNVIITGPPQVFDIDNIDDFDF
jgi:rhamnose transport system substrate-binding protein